ncbi:type II secretion system protein GspM [Marinospirillum sp.]|uniref:type II secretion system protein GspM n=1 Tax=Marinospirillum sp. TaxID=2183934 RepID=UPI0028709279|nr:type II secretion system protein GspM [Marinospirillum sp.]MDR9468581.1 type II secretion system protein GspM [Marinospirillum sp.]
MIHQLKDYWAGLEAREQRLIKLGGPVIVLLALYLLVWEPLREGREAGAGAQQQSNDERLLSYLQGLRGQLQPVQAMTERRWQALAQSQGLRQVQANEEAGRWLLKAQAGSQHQVQRFLQAAAEQGWHWDAVQMQERPVKLKVELRPL